jgi:tripartite-type tricarboxylate transporter receptor subunit TctC
MKLTGYLKLAAVGAVAFSTMMSQAVAQNFPERPITLIVPYAPGGTTDVLGRALGDALSRSLNQTVVVENRPGANGTMGVMNLKRAQPDGYTLSMIPLGVFRQPYIQNVSYDPAKDLTYISMVGGYNYAIAVKSDAPWKTIEELVEYTRANPGDVFYGVSARYSVNEFLMMDLAKKLGLNWTSVPFKGDSEAITNLLGGQIQAVSATNTILPFSQAGQVRVLATGGVERSADFPDAPTLTEAGYPVAVSSPLGIAGPAGMPEDVTKKLDEAIKTALQDPKLIETAGRFGIELNYLDHKGYTQYAQEAAVNEKDAVQTMLDGATKG